MGGFGAAANLYLNSRESRKVLVLPVGQRFPRALSVARKDPPRRKNTGSRVRRKVRDQDVK